MSDYLDINKRAYNTLADEYHSKWDVRAYVLNATMNTFVRNLKYDFSDNKIKVLDVGCGVGKRTAFMSKRGFKVTGIDYAENAIAFARKRVQGASFINYEFMKWRSHVRYQGIVAGAFLPLFPRFTVPRIIRKFNKLLVKNGFLYTNFSIEKEGIVVKRDFKRKVSRYRNGISIELALEELSRYFEVIEITTDIESIAGSRGKVWYNITLKKLC